MYSQVSNKRGARLFILGSVFAPTRPYLIPTRLLIFQFFVQPKFEKKKHNLKKIQISRAAQYQTS